MHSATYIAMALFAFMSVTDSENANLEIELKQQKNGGRRPNISARDGKARR